MDDITIAYLADAPEHVPVLARWVHERWGGHDPTLTFDSASKMLTNRLNKDKIPLVFVALQLGVPIGVVGLKDRIELAGYDDRSPWIGGLLVIDEFRNKGIGSKLLDRACAKAKELGYSKVSLFTTLPAAVAWYEHKNWRKFATAKYQNSTATLFELDLNIKRTKNVY